MDARPDAIDCPECLAVARRTMGSPNVGLGDRSAIALQDATRATADRPQVVGQPAPAQSRQRVTHNPLHQTLPRP